MPGMATDAEITKLEGLKGTASDIYFLQLMIRHHEGGAAMMSYAADHAASPVVRNFASKMLESQTSEIGVMTGMLEARGAKPLPLHASDQLNSPISAPVGLFAGGDAVEFCLAPP